MMFAGLTSAYIVKRDQPNWTSFEMPKIFWYSTAAILFSSLTIQLAFRSFKEREMQKYRRLVLATVMPAYTVAPVTAVAKGHGWVAMYEPMTRKPRANTLLFSFIWMVLLGPADASGQH